MKIKKTNIMETIKREDIKSKKVDFPSVPLLFDLVQEVQGCLQIPEIRVWVHPGGDDYYEVFPTFEEALRFIEKTKGAEDSPLIAFRGYEVNIFDLPTVIDDEEK